MRKPGYALATILILLGASLFMAGSLVTIANMESKIGRSQKEGVMAYYAAESGMESAMWNLNNNSTDTSALAAGNLNRTYTITDKPQVGQSFTVHLYTDAVKGAGYGTVDVTGTSNNGSFTASRKLQTKVFRGGTAGLQIGAPVYSGGTLSVLNGNSVVNFLGGDIYGTSQVFAQGATINMNNNNIATAGSWTTSGGVTVNDLNSVNYLPAPLNTPGFDFTYYSTHYDNRYTPTQFRTLVTNASPVLNLPGPVTYISGNVSLANNWAKNKTININGMLIINGTFTTNANGLVINVTDPGTHKSGIFASSNITNTKGAWNINGVVYSGGNIIYSNSENNTINGSIIASGNVTINVNSTMTATFVENVVSATVGIGEPPTLNVQHWEEEY